MVIPSIDLMARKVVQLVQGREQQKAFELPNPLQVLERFEAYPEIQVIDLDAALGRDGQPDIIRDLCQRKPCRVGGGIRTCDHAVETLRNGAHKVIVSSAVFSSSGINFGFLERLAEAVPRERLMIAVDCLGDHVAIRGWREILPLTACEVLPQLESYCSEFLSTYIDAEGKLQGTNLDWFRSLRSVTRLPITAAGGITTDDEVAALEGLGMHVASGMAIYRKVFPEVFQVG